MQTLTLIAMLFLGAGCTAPDVVLGGRRVVDRTQQPSAAGEQRSVDASAGTTEPPRAGMSGSTAPAGRSGSDAMVTAGMSTGCGSAGATGDNRVQVNGGTGNYLVDLPLGYDGSKPYPLVFALRASDETAESFRESLNLVPLAGPTAIVVHADCLNGASAWNVQRDVPYLDALISHVLQRYCVDPTRVFFLGYGQGGWMASELACQHGDRMRAAALIAGTVPMTSCLGSVAMFLAQGTMDSVYPLSAGRNTRDFWVRRNMCQETTTPASPAPCVDYARCAAESPVRYCEYVGNHELPSFAASAAWAFFETLR